MAFTFQINNDLQFNHDTYLLNKAELNRPTMVHETYTSETLCELVKDEIKLEGVTCADTDQKLSNLKLKKGDQIILDFKDHRVGQFSIDIDSIGSPMDAPLYLRFRFAEVPAELAHESHEYDGWLAKGWIQEEFFHIDELPCHFALPRRYAFRYVEITVIDTSPKWQAVFSNPTVVTESCVKEEEESYKLEDQELQKIYNVGLKTLHDCMIDVFEDGPKRDRRLWLGDLRLQAKANYVTYKNKELVRRCLYLFAGTTVDDGRISANVFTKPNVIPDDSFLFDYSLFFTSVLYDYVQEYKEEELLKDLYPIAKKQMDYSLNYVKEDGELILEEEYPVFVDWSNEFDKSTSGQAIMIYTLKQFIALGEMMDEDMTTYKEMLASLTAYTKNNLYDAKRHLFVSKGEYNIASQAWMVLAGVLSDEENHHVMEACVHELFPVKNVATPYMYHHVTEALFIAGMKEEAIDLIKSYWGKMVDLGADTFWEAFDPDQPDYSPYGSPIISSYCHAWSCTVVYLLKKYL
jgi:alpha-L-rhamnosidase